MSLLPRPGREMKEQEVRPSNEMHDQIGEVLVGDFKNLLWCNPFQLEMC
jgi:hypothetical protein